MPSDDYTDACERLTPSEIALILQADPEWRLPLGGNRHRDERRMDEAKTILAFGEPPRSRAERMRIYHGL